MTIILLLAFVNIQFVVGQDLPATGTVIGNSNARLKRNKVFSIDQFEYPISHRKTKSSDKIGKKIMTEYYDNFGRNTQVIYYSDNSRLIEKKVKYFYADTIGYLKYRIEEYDNKDSLISVRMNINSKGDTMFFLPNKNITCFGHYKFIYNSKELIEKAIWYAPKKGIWANENMVAYKTIQLVYIFKEL